MAWFAEKILDTMIVCSYVVAAFFDMQVNWEEHAGPCWQVWRDLDKWPKGSW